MFRKRIPLLIVAASSLLASCNGGNAQNSANSRVDAKIDFNTVFNITKYSNKVNVGTMEFLPLTENTISIRFAFDKSFDDTFVFTYRTTMFSVARRCGENEQPGDRLFNYPYVEKHDSLHKKLSKVVYEGETKTTIEGVNEVNDFYRILLNGSGNLIFEYDATFDPSKHFYACEGASFIGPYFVLTDENGKIVDEDCWTWYHFSNKDLFKDEKY
ncbi:MAG: hypothetical protein K6F36_04220 [Bacilli bacterium]|nr:hypothetical protein [Bacilli bacterium]